SDLIPCSLLSRNSFHECADRCDRRPAEVGICARTKPCAVMGNWRLRVRYDMVHRPLWSLDAPELAARSDELPEAGRWDSFIGTGKSLAGCNELRLSVQGRCRYGVY